MSMITENVAQIRSRIAAAARADGRPTVLKKQLSLYDAVVVSGRDLYEGKILN